ASMVDVGQLALGRLAKALEIDLIGQLGHLQQDFGLGDERARVGEAKLRSECVERDHRPAPVSAKGDIAEQTRQFNRAATLKSRQTRRLPRHYNGRPRSVRVLAQQA